MQGCNAAAGLLGGPTRVAIPSPSRPGAVRCRAVERDAEAAEPDRAAHSGLYRQLSSSAPSSSSSRDGGGGGYTLGPQWLKNAPQIRVRSAEHRCRDQLLELAVLNERLAGENPYKTRRKVEYLKMRRQNWERIYNYITKQDAAATLRSIEEASRKVEEALSEEAREKKSVEDLRVQLSQLQDEVDLAHKKLHLTEARVQLNMTRVKELKREAESLEHQKQTRSYQPNTDSKTRGRSSVQENIQFQLQPLSVSNVIPSPQKTKTKKSGLYSSLDMEEGLQNFWYPIAFSSKLDNSTLIPFDLLESPWVLFRDENGRPACIYDECAHRACPLSLGKVVDGHVQCPYHGWEYNKEGEVVKMPSTVQCKNLGVSHLRVAEKDGFIWAWPGEGEAPEIPRFTQPPEGYEIHAEIEVKVPVEHGLLLENLLDLAHAPFTHTSTFAKGWPVPDFVKFRAARLLGGNWEPYPIDMSFEPPCMVVSTIGLAQPGKIETGQRALSCQNHLHQLHVCLPSKKGEVRLLYRMSLDFLQWARKLPFMEVVWTNVANQVLGEDLVLVKGQQDRMIKGGDTWRNPVSYDKLAVRYRRWRNSVDAHSEEAPPAESMKMSAGEMFKPEDEENEITS